MITRKEEGKAKAFAKYNAITKLAEAKYNAIRDPAYAKYKVIADPAVAEFNAIRAAAWAEYVAEIKAIKKREEMITRKEHIQAIILEKLDHVIDEEITSMGVNYPDTSIAREVLFVMSDSLKGLKK